MKEKLSTDITNFTNDILFSKNYTSYFTGDPLDVTTNHQYGVV